MICSKPLAVQEALIGLLVLSVLEDRFCLACLPASIGRVFSVALLVRSGKNPCLQFEGDNHAFLVYGFQVFGYLIKRLNIYFVLNTLSLLQYCRCLSSKAGDANACVAYGTLPWNGRW